jgi:nucleotide-binding universal stress UspA family protein
MIKRVLVALDGSDHAKRAMDLACELAGRFDAELIALHVIPDKPVSQAERRIAEMELQAAMAGDFDAAPQLEVRGDARLQSQRPAEQAAAIQGRLRWAVAQRLMSDALTRATQKAVQKVRTITRAGDPAKEILSVAHEEQADIIVMGRRGLGDLAGLLLGSVSHKVTHLAECACLTVK